MRFRLRTLLIVLALGPVVFAGGWLATTAWREYWASLEKRVQLQHEQMMDESRRIEK